jgi:hypothetical protein
VITSRRQFLKTLGAAFMIGATHGILGRRSVLPKLEDLPPHFDPVDPKVLAVREAVTISSMVAILKEIYDPFYVKDLVYNSNPLLSMVLNNSSYSPILLQYGEGA